MEVSEWEPRKNEIERLYVKENKSLSQVIEILKAHGFSKTKAQYERKIKQWGLRKYQTKSSDWKYANGIIKKRDQKKSESAVYINGTRCDPSKVQKEISRHCFVSTIERFREVTAPSPQTPDAMVVCTPVPTLTHFEWSPNMPWLQFSNALRMNIDTGRDGILYQIVKHFSASFAFQDTSVTWGSSFLRGLVSYTGDKPTVSQVTTFLNTYMPEEYVGQHLKTAQGLIESRKGLSHLENLSAEIFFLSNEIYGSDRADVNINVCANLLARIFEKIGPNALQNLDKLPGDAGITVLAVAENIFRRAVKAGDLQATRLLLGAGIDPDLPTIELGLRCTPLAEAAGISNERMSLDMVNLLLQYKPSLDGLRTWDSPLCRAILSRNKQVVELLLVEGAYATPEALCLAIGNGDAGIIGMLLQKGVDINMRPLNLFFSWSRKLPLEMAVDRGDYEPIKLLLNSGANVNALTDLGFEERKCKTTVLGQAAKKGDTTTVRLLLNAPMNCWMDIPSETYIPPLTLAVEYSGYDVVKELLKNGADIYSADTTGKKTLLERAAHRADLKICKTLLSAGAMINRPMVLNKLESTSALVIAIRRNAFDIVKLLLNHGAHASESLHRAPETALGEAIQVGNCEILRLLWEAGCHNPGGRIFCIGTLEAAIFLQQAGVLTRVLQADGENILANAILARHKDLVSFLLGPSASSELGMSVEKMQFPLEAAVLVGDIEVISSLITREAQVTEGVLIAAVAHALQTKNDDVIRQVIAFPVPFPTAAPTAITMAAEHNEYNLVRLLLDAGFRASGRPLAQRCEHCYAERCYQNDSGAWWHRATTSDYSALEAGAEQGDPSILCALLQAEMWPAKIIGRALVHTISARHNHLVQDLVNAGVDLNTKTYEDGSEPSTPLLSAIDNDAVVVTSTLIEAGADVNYAPHGASYTPLQLAAMNGNMELVDMLLKKGADVNAAPGEQGRTALQFAATKGYLSIARVLLEAGADINARRALDGRTALEGAAEKGRLEMLSLLMMEGAEIRGYGRKQFIRAIKLAEWNGHKAAAILLKSRGGWTEEDRELYNEEDVDSERIEDEFTAYPDDETPYGSDED